jgi:ferritin-like metal-binding protein YciE
MGEGDEARVDAGRVRRPDAGPAQLDTEIIAVAQRVEHYEIAAYGCLVNYAQLMGLSDAVALLTESLEEEKAADKNGAAPTW